MTPDTIVVLALIPVYILVASLLINTALVSVQTLNYMSSLATDTSLFVHSTEGHKGSRAAS